MTETVREVVSPRVRRSPTLPLPSPVENALIRSPLARRRGAFAWSFVVLLLSDVVAVVASAWICVELSRSPESLAHLSTLLGVAVAWLGMRFASGLYPGFGIAPPEALRLSVITTLVAAVAHSATMVSLKMPVESRSVTV